MSTLTANPAVLRRLWRASPTLITTAFLMIPLLALTLTGIAADPRLVTGAPVWLKPAKFAASIAIYSFTLAWIFTLIEDWRKTRLFVGWMTAVVLVLEMVLISYQASRGVTSHFNVSTPFDTAVFATMGSAIVIQTLSMFAVAVAVWRHRFEDRALGWAIRFGVLITIAGAFTGGLMTRPTQAQLDAAHAGERMLIAGAHTVGAPDGGPGLPGTGWSTEHGDLRVPHFVGLHAIQALPLFAMVLAQFRRTRAIRVPLTVVAAGSYASLFAYLLAQALRGEPLF